VLARRAAQLKDPAASVKAEAARARVAEYDAQISRYRASLDAGGDPPWPVDRRDPGQEVTAQAETRCAAALRRHHLPGTRALSRRQLWLAYDSQGSGTVSINGF
jgi:hypothetical protein